VRLEGREATHPLRPGRRRLAPDRRSGEVAFGVALPVRLGIILKGPEQPAPAKLLSRVADIERWSLDDVAAPFVTVPR
jgi:hypothetical protein